MNIIIISNSVENKISFKKSILITSERYRENSRSKAENAVFFVLLFL